MERISGTPTNIYPRRPRERGGALERGRAVINLGDITKISGYAVPPVEVVIGGSPCQDLSVAGKRAGLDGERSGLFMEQIRIIKEMRQRDIRSGRSNELIRPRFMVWENVPGAFSSKKGEDFRAVLEETAHVVDPGAAIPRPPKGKWPNAGAIVADGWSLAWRVLDAQFWGVPQRRRRIALVADFGGQSAPEILFERESVSGNPAESGDSRKGIAGDTEGGVDPANKAGGITYCLQGNCIDRADTAGCNGKGWTEDVSYTLNTIDRPAVCYSIDRAAFNQGKNAKYEFEVTDSGKSSTLVSREPSAVCYDIDCRNGNLNQTALPIQARMSTSLNAGGIICMATQQGGAELRTDDKAPTLTAAAGMSGNGQADNTGLHEKVGALNCMHDQQAVLDFGRIADRIYINADKSVTLQAQGGGGGAKTGLYCFTGKTVVRRLTPLECERLQGFPDGWTDIGDYTDSKGKRRQTTDTARYKALGNSIAIPPWTWVLERLNGYCKDHTMASLFDGIGGFPLIWERLNGKGSCLWSSEIEEFPIAVTRKHFGDEDR